MYSRVIEVMEMGKRWNRRLSVLSSFIICNFVSSPCALRHLLITSGKERNNTCRICNRKSTHCTLNVFFTNSLADRERDLTRCVD